MDQEIKHAPASEHYDLAVVSTMGHGGSHDQPVVAAMAMVAGGSPGASFPSQPSVFPRNFSSVCAAILPSKEDELGCKRGELP